uniref:Uncharacterized protein n=1 Tax=Hanusia phi TaxID=3032 RepID=A0A7S0EFK5_9CRYP|mmetsp:Transcript_22593/g.50905  ORF Transcript_22593/g.50905 Transcript_22593/m.50905 type:complete len:258 (+) Transcript_22593:42-815(+)
MARSVSKLSLCLFGLLLLCHVVQAGRGGRSSGRGSGGGADEEIIIPLGGEVDTVLPMGGMSLPLNPSMMIPPKGGEMGFEETEEIGPDGKPHIISERSFGGPGKKLTKAEMKKQKQLTREMQGMAKDMAHMFEDGAFFDNRKKSSSLRKDEKYEQDLFKNAVRAFQTQDGKHGGTPMIANPSMMSSYPSGMDRRRSRKVNGWQITGNTDILNQVGIVIASCAILGAIVFVGFRYYKTKVQYTPMADDGIEHAPFRSL